MFWARLTTFCNAIISGCSNLSERVYLPGTKSCKINIQNAKHEFDAQLRECLNSVKSPQPMDAVVDVAETPLTCISSRCCGNPTYMH